MKPKSFGERGQALILIALAAIALVAITGLAIDGSNKYSDRRHAQNAADTAALAAALEKTNRLTAGDSNEVCSTSNSLPYTTFCDSIIQAAWDRATENGYDSMLSNNVEVFSPPISGPYTGQMAYLQVIITSDVNTYFMRVIGINQSQNIVQATAISGKGGTLGDGAMLISYDPDPGCSSGGGSGGGSFDISGSGTVNLTGGGIFVNSDEVCGFIAPNCPDLQITGGSGINSAAHVDNIDQKDCTGKVPPISPVPENLNQSPVIIPDDLNWPDVPAECGFNAPTPTKLGTASDGKEEWLIYPGFYVNFPQASLVTNKSHIYMSSGVYCIDPPMNQDLSWSPVDFVSLNGSTDPSINKYHTYNPNGVTLYIKKGGGFSINANNQTFLDAPTSGNYGGYLIILEGERSSIQSCSITGGSDININGMIFAPYCNITVNGGSDSTAKINAQLIGWDLKIDGNNTINFNYDPKYTVKIKRKVGLMK
jgi:hypothetical protein